MLQTPDFSQPFSVVIDVSRDAAGVLLLQHDESNNDEQPVALFSNTFNQHQRNYSTIEKELLPLILALQH